MKKIFALSLLLALTACKKDVETDVQAPAEKAEAAQPAGIETTKEGDVPKVPMDQEQTMTVTAFVVPEPPTSICAPPPLPVEPIEMLPVTKPFDTHNLQTQFFTVDASKGGTVTGKDGTKLAIPGNAFVDASGKPVNGNVTVTIKEALSMTDIVLGGLTTTSNGKILESGGMIHVEASVNGEPLAMAPTKEIMVTIPTADRLDGMQLFTGDVKDDKTINWVNPKDIIVTDEFEAIAPGPVRDTVIGFVSFDIPPPVKPVEYKGDGNDLIEVNIEYPQFFPELSFYKGVEWMLVDQASNKKGDAEKEWVKVDIARSKKQGVYVLTFTDAKKKKKSYDVVPVFEGDNYEKAMAEYDKKLEAYEIEKQERRKLEQRQAARQRTILKAQDYADAYVFPMRQLGWVNCDRFYNMRGAKEAIVRAVVDDTNNAFAYMVFTKRNICLPGYLNEGAFVFDNGFGPMVLPIGEEVLILAVSGSEGKQRFGMEKAVIAEELTVTLQLKETTPEKIREMLNANLKRKL